MVEGLLIVIIAVMLLQSRFSPKATEDEEGLTEKVRSLPVASTQQESWQRIGAWQQLCLKVLLQSCPKVLQSASCGVQCVCVL